MCKSVHSIRFAQEARPANPSSFPVVQFSIKIDLLLKSSFLLTMIYFFLVISEKMHLVFYCGCRRIAKHIPDQNSKSYYWKNWKGSSTTSWHLNSKIQGSGFSFNFFNSKFQGCGFSFQFLKYYHDLTIFSSRSESSKSTFFSSSNLFSNFADFLYFFYFHQC